MPGPRGDRWRRRRRGPRPRGPGNQGSAHRLCGAPSPQRPARPNRRPGRALKRGPWPFPEFGLEDSVQVFANHLQRSNSEHLMKVHSLGSRSEAGVGKGTKSLNFNEVSWGVLCFLDFGVQEIKRKSLGVLVCAPSSQCLAFLQNCFHAKGPSGNFSGHC